MLELTVDGPHVAEADRWMRDLLRCEGCFALRAPSTVTRQPVADDPDRAMWICSVCDPLADDENAPEISGLPVNT